MRASLLSRAGAWAAFAMLALAVGSAFAAGAGGTCAPPRSEVLALKDFYEELNGPGWRHQGGWLKGNPCGTAEQSDGSYGGKGGRGRGGEGGRGLSLRAPFVVCPFFPSLVVGTLLSPC